MLAGAWRAGGGRCIDRRIQAFSKRLIRSSGGGDSPTLPNHRTHPYRSAMRTLVSLVMLALFALALLRKRWAYVAFMTLALLRIPLRTGFDFERPVCALTPTRAQVVESFGNTPHVIIFAVLFIVTAVQFRGALARRLGWTTLIALGFGILLELEQTLTRTGNCDLHDLVPNAVGMVIGAVVIAAGSWIVRARRGVERD